MSTRLVTGLVLVSTAAVGIAGPLRDNEMIIGGGSSKADSLWVSGPSLYLRRATPGVAVGMVQLPGRNKGSAYLLVIKGDERRKALARYDSKSEASGPVGRSRGFVEIAGQRVAFEYKAEVDPTGKQPPREVLSINGKALDLASGRVVLVDLSTSKVSWMQARIALPKAPVWPTETVQVESQAKQLLKVLRRAAKKVRDFLK